jgi:hypothetical protein
MKQPESDYNEYNRQNNRSSLNCNNCCSSRRLRLHAIHTNRSQPLTFTFPDGVPNPVKYAVTDAGSNFCTPNSNTNSNPSNYAITNANGNSNSFTNANPHPHINRHTDPNSNINPQSQPNRNPYARTYPHTCTRQLNRCNNNQPP